MDNTIAYFVIILNRNYTHSSVGVEAAICDMLHPADIYSGSVSKKFKKITIKQVMKMETYNSQQALKQTFKLLKYTFVIVPIVAGADKFTNLLTHWEQYVNPSIASLLPFSDSVFMMIVGIIEIAAGFIVLKRAEIGGYIVAGWLTIVALTLLASFSYVDVAVRDLVMAISALSMARISKINA